MALPPLSHVFPINENFGLQSTAAATRQHWPADDFLYFIFFLVFNGSFQVTRWAGQIDPPSCSDRLMANRI